MWVRIRDAHNFTLVLEYKYMRYLGSVTQLEVLIPP
jgi:hypothetical protein